MSKCLQTSVLVRDLRTEIVVQPYADRILVLVTQLGKVGYLIQASVPSMADLHDHTLSDGIDAGVPLPVPSPAIQLTPIFGSAPSTHMQTLYALYTAQIATLVWMAVGDQPHSVVVGIALEKSEEHTAAEVGEGEQETFCEVMHALQTLLQHACT